MRRHPGNEIHIVVFPRRSGDLDRPGACGPSLARTHGVKVIDDPYDPVFVTLGLSLGRVELQIGEGSGGRFARLTPSDARKVATALSNAADALERDRRE